MNLPNPYFGSRRHHRRHRVLVVRPCRPERLATLMARFSPGFSMITMSGTVLDYAGVDALFSHGHGARPGLVIDIDELRAAVWSDGATIGYRETQTDAQGRRTVRRSTAVFRREADGLIVWRHLHETPVAA